MNVSNEKLESFIWQAREMLKGKPVRYGPGHATRRHCYHTLNKKTGLENPSRCYEVHLIGSLNSGNVFRDDIAVGGPDWPAMVFAEWNIHENKYERVWGLFSGLLGDSESLDLSKALK